MSFPHLEPHWWRWAVAGGAFISAVTTTHLLARRHPQSVSVPERRLAMLYSPTVPSVVVLMFFILIALATLIQAVLRHLADIDITWIRSAAQWIFLFLVPIGASVDFDDPWKMDLID